MSNAEVGCYIKLLCFCWDRGSIPNNICKISKLCNEPKKIMAQLWPSIKPCFENGNLKGRLIHPRLYKERKKQIEFKEERAASGKKGANVRWEKGDNSAIAEPMPKPIAKNGSAVCSLQPASTSSIIEEGKDLAPTERKILNELKKVKNYPYSFTDTIEYIRELAVEFPDIDILDEIQKKVTWWRDNPLTKKSNPHLQLRNWFTNAVKFNAERRRDHMVGGQTDREKIKALYEKQKRDGLFDDLDKED